MSELAAEVLRALTAAAGSVAEVYLKRGRTRRYQVGVQGGEVTLSEERGWAVRAGSERASFFAAGTGQPSPAGPWPEGDGRGLRLPEPTGPARWRPPADLEAPLAGERESFALLEGIEKGLRARLPGSRLLHGELEDGSSHAELSSSLGTRAEVRRRLARLRLGLAGPGGAPATLAVELAEREPRRFSPSDLAEALAARLTARAAGRPVALDRGEMLLAPAVAAAIVAGLVPLFLGPDATARARRFRDRRGRIGSPLLTVVDDGRLPQGLLTAPVDGEGTATREVTLVEEGVFRQPLLAWWQGSHHARTSGCVARPGWRDLPRPAPTHLYLRPDARAGAGVLAGSLGRGYHLLDVLGSGRFDFDGDRLAVPVCGFAMRGGRTGEPVTDSWLCGGISAFLRGIRAVGRDLEFLPLGGLIGSPSLVVSGLELRGEP